MERAWEAFEARAKVALVENPHGTRLVIKSSRCPRTRSARVVARLTTMAPRHVLNANGDKSVVIAQGASGFTTTGSTVAGALSKLTRLLRFAMQEVLGPMKASSSASHLTSPRAGGANPVAPSSGSNTTSSSTSSNIKKRSKNKKAAKSKQ